MKNIVVTGGAGFIGSNFIHYMQHKYPELFISNIDKMTYAASMRNLDGVFEDRHKLYEYDIGWDWNVGSMANLIKERNTEWVVHFAAESHVDNSISNSKPFIQTNVMGTIHVLEAIKEAKNGCKLLHVSTDEVYGSLSLNEEVAFIEGDEFKPSSPYAASKAAAEMFVVAYGKTWNLPYIIVNSANAYGPRQHPEKFIPKIITNAFANKPIPLYGSGDNERQWTYVWDIATAIDTVMDNGTIGGRYNIGSNDIKLNNLQIIKFILAMMNKPDSLIQHVKDRPGHDLRYCVDTYAIEELGWKQKVLLVDGLENTIDWYNR